VTGDNRQKFSQDSQHPDREFSPEPREQETGAATTIQQHLHTRDSSGQLPESLDIN
jgi:hypothetical protein